MNTDSRYAHSPDEVSRMGTQQLLNAFVSDDLFRPGKANALYSRADRILVFGVVPTDTRLALPVPDEVRAEYVLQRREAGILNIGGPGVLTADDIRYEVGNKEAVYVGKGTRDLVFESLDTSDPAVFYVFTALAQITHPTTLITRDLMNVVQIGDEHHSNVRTLHQCIIEGHTASANIAFGFTTVHEGSVWNTLPPHLHDRRTECYLYFDLPADERIFHVMGLPEETRHLVLRDRSFVISPSWSLHFGAGTAPYSFIWATAGENATYDDMDPVPVAGIR